MATKRRPSAPGLELDIGKLCEAVEAERQERGLTQHRLADELGVDYTTMCVWRRGRGGMNGDVALRIACWLPADLRDFAKEPAVLDPAASDAA
jgi:DNA-binding XRE family transcriptional regulator